MLPVRRHAEVEDDILNIASWIARASPETAWRFLDAVESSVASLRFMPAKGSPKQFRNKRLAGARSWFVSGFPKYLIFYLVRPDHIFVLGVIHGARKYRSLLASRAK
jgi:toxin ParE1/3/4